MHFLAFHLRLVSRNMTTIELLEKEHAQDQYNIGVRENFVAVFGTNPLVWLLPVWSSPISRDDPMAGCFFPERQLSSFQTRP